MSHNLKDSIVKLFMTAVLALLIVLMGVVMIGRPLKILTVEAQGPVGYDQEEQKNALDETLLKSFNLTPEAIQNINNLPFDLQVTQTAGKTAVDSGEEIAFNILIKNNGPNPVSFARFKNEPPAQLQDIKYQFSLTEVISDGLATPTWLFTKSIALNETIAVTVSGKLVSENDVTVANTATVDAFNAVQETDKTNNSATVNVQINGTNPGPSFIYLPAFFKSPLVLAYFEDFSSSNAWSEFNSNGCQTDNTSGQYWVDLQATDRECLPPARDQQKPESPYRTYGEFEVLAYHSEGQSNAAYGLFINGQGGSNYYFFRIYPNNSCSTGGDWQLFRKRSGTETKLLEKLCDPAIRRGYGAGASNLLRIAHTTDRRLTLYINGIQVGSVTDDATNHLTGTGAGLYIRSRDRLIRIKFDDFRVLRLQ